jgi:3-hydroxyacyl-[acyl-carrier-protein] dehydratase
LSDDFAHSIISLKEARNVKYADFVQPGQTLEITVSVLKKDDRLAQFKMEGQIAERAALSGRIVLERYNLADSDPDRRPIDEQLNRHFRRLQKLLLPNRLAVTVGQAVPDRTVPV